ncbi:hypothetical protein [Nocardioides sp.]|uniref:hypothetical protein n=1 Tax=Nocardioides sp. TaxID=35761 RepID=UPI0027371DED|nr:hypothetical protein [Nocardioides sp.]MDP3892794.1 hypothetical protein [Nocardioides sp.]
MGVVRRAGAAVLLLLAGAATSLSIVALHHRTWALGLGLAATLLALAALPPGWWSRLPFGVGWVLVVGLASVGRPEGGHVLSGTTRGHVVLAAAFVVVLLTVATLPRRHADR